MFTHMIARRLIGKPLTAALLLTLFTPSHAQSTATLQGRVLDSNGAAVSRAKVTVHNQATGVERTAQTDSEGAYQVAALPAGVYRVEVRSTGFETQFVDRLIVEVGRIMTGNPRIREIDLNPVIVHPEGEGVVALDALMLVEG